MSKIFSVDVSTIKKYGATFVIFINGGLVFAHLSYFKYGSPNHFWKGSWIKLVVHCVVALYCAVWLVYKSTQKR